MKKDKLRSSQGSLVETLERRCLYSAALTPAIQEDTVPRSLISDTKSKSAVWVEIENTGTTTSTGAGSISFILSSDGFAADGTVINTVKKKSLKIAPQKKLKIGIPLKAIPSLTSGVYTAVVEIITAAGNTTQSFATTSVEVAAAYASLTPSIVGPTMGGRGKYVSVPVSNGGNIAYHGKMTISIFASPSDVSSSSTLDIADDSNSPLVSQQFNLSIPSGATKKLQILLSPAQATQAGSGMSAQVTSSTGNVSSSNNILQTFVEAFEDSASGPSQYAYNDGEGNITIGIGSNITGKSGRNKIAAVFGDTVNYDWLVAGKDDQGNPYGLSAGQIEALYGYDINNAYNIAKAVIPAIDTLTTQQQTAIIDLAFNAPSYLQPTSKNGAYAHYGIDFVKDVNDGDWYAAGQDLTTFPRYNLPGEPGLITRSNAEIALLQDAHYHSTSTLNITADYDDGTTTTSGSGSGPVTTDIDLTGVFNSAQKTVMNTASGTVVYNLSATYYYTPDDPDDGEPSSRSEIVTRTFDISGPPSQVVGSTPGEGGVIDYVTVQVADSISGVFTSELDGDAFGPPSSFT